MATSFEAANNGGLAEYSLEKVDCMEFAEAIGIPFFLHRGDKLVYANAAFATLIGYSPAVLQAMPYYEVAHPNWQATLKDHTCSPRATEGKDQASAPCAFRLNTCNGSEVWVEARTQIATIEGQLTVIATCMDITGHRRVLAQRQRLLEMHRHAQHTLREILDGDPVPTFVIDANHVVTHWNRACEFVIGSQAADLVGTRLQWRPFYPEPRPVLADLMVDGGLEDRIGCHYHGKYRPSPGIPGAFEAEDFFPHMGQGGRWLHFTAAPMRDKTGRIIGAIETLEDITERRRAEEALRQTQADLEILVEKRTAQLAAAKAELEHDIARREAAEHELLRRCQELTELNIKLCETNEKLEEAHGQLIQAEKLASIGQLAAGVAHEINNPIGYVQSNLGTLDRYLENLFAIIAAHEAADTGKSDRETVNQLRNLLEFDYLKEDVPVLLSEFREGVGRVRKIVQDLRDFSRVDQTQDWQLTDLHQCLESTLNIASNDIKYKADVHREYGELPQIRCLPSQLNQVFLNLLVNASQAIDSKRGTITIRTGRADEQVWVEIADNGCGIPEDIRHRIFDPFFTTKPVGKGTGLGLSLSYGIIKKHHGQIDIASTPGQGTTFRITLPITPPAEPAPV